MSSATSLPQLPSDNHRLNYGDNVFFEIDYFQDENTNNYRSILKNCPSSSHPETFHIRLQVHDITRRHFSAEADAEPVFEEVTHVAPVTEHYVPVISKHEVGPIELQRLIDATRVPGQVLPSFMETLWSFMREVVPVTKKNRRVVVRPFTMIIKIVRFEFYDWDTNPVESSESLPKYELYEDCFEKVRFDEDGFCSEKTTGESCSICFEHFKVGVDLRRLPCSHVYHGDCIVKWLCTKPTCPLCRFMLI